MVSAPSLFAAVIWIVTQMLLVSVCMWMGSLLSVRLREVSVWGLDLAPYSFTIARALLTKAQVICACSKENIIMSIACVQPPFPLKKNRGGTSYKIPHFVKICLEK